MTWLITSIIKPFGITKYWNSCHFI